MLGNPLLSSILWTIISQLSHGYSVGPMPIRTLYDAFLPMPEPFEPREVPLGAFNRVPQARTEKEFQRRFLEALKQLKVFEDFEIIDCSSLIDKFSGTLIRPDSAVYPKEKPQIILLRWGKLEIFFEFKRLSSRDPHRSDDIDPESNDMLEEVDNLDAITIRGQIFSYLGAQLSRQPGRAYTFAVGVYGSHARQYICDRSGVIVSVLIPYTKTPQLLLEFFERYERMSEEQRGVDVTVSLASPKERDVFLAALNQFKKLERAGKVRSIPSASPSYHKGHEAYKIPVVDSQSAEIKHFVIIRSFRERLLPFGPGTQIYIALGVDELDMDKDIDDMKRLPDRLCLLKDIWRVETARSETDVYGDLKTLKIAHVAPLMLGGDVKTLDGKLQMTPVAKWSKDNSEDVKAWRLHCLPLDNRVHHRLILKLAYPLSSASSAKELVQVIRDALYSLIQAHKKGILHRNISNETIMISGTKYTSGPEKLARGLLSGWENSRSTSSVQRSQLSISVSGSRGSQVPGSI
ncbi:hypothetical protein K474DRAFT_137705 [Panus rudis PR-1116 ss-1]|nr:hypothetical protein K474DRAFT_137705 [Panus rudis PR-1116 ss-1]